MFCGKSAYVDLLAVLPEYQKKGYGKALLNKFFDEALKKGIDEAAIRTKCYLGSYIIYRKMGFVDQQSDTRYMTKYISPKKDERG